MSKRTESTRRTLRKPGAVQAPSQREPDDGPPAGPTHAEIAARAYDLYWAQGTHGHDLEDWLQAEHELVARADETLDRRGR